MGTGEIALRLGDVAFVQGDPGGSRVGEDARHVILQAAVLDDLPRFLGVGPGVRPVASLHREHRALGQGDRDGGDRPVPIPELRRVLHRSIGCSCIAGEPLRDSEQEHSRRS